MIAKIRGVEITCPICHNNEFDVAESVRIQAVKSEYSESVLYNICKDELECKECGWTGYFNNDYDHKQDWKIKKIIYSR